MFGAPTGRRNDVGLHRYQGLNYNVFYTVHDNLVVDSDLLKIFCKLGQVPLACILVRIIVILWLVEV